jgi:hypothetical protein
VLNCEDAAASEVALDDRSLLLVVSDGSLESAESTESELVFWVLAPVFVLVPVLVSAFVADLYLRPPPLVRRRDRLAAAADALAAASTIAASAVASDRSCSFCSDSAIDACVA